MKSKFTTIPPFPGIACQQAQAQGTANPEFKKNLTGHQDPLSPRVALAASSPRFATIGGKHDLYRLGSRKPHALFAIKNPFPLSGVALTPDGKQVFAAPPVSCADEFEIPR